MERRLAAILAADVVGYSRLMGADEAGTVAALRTLREELFDPMIAQHNGRTVKLMGDGTLVEFGSVVDAVNCAVAVQSALAGRNADVPEDRRIELRIGINLGDLIVEGDDLYGDGVNIAARLEGLASHGGICVSAKVFEEARGKVDVRFEDLGLETLKNIAEPVHVYRVVPGSPAAAAYDAPAAPKERPLILAAATALLIAASLATAWWVWERFGDGPVVSLPDKPSIAVLPFEDLSEEPRQWLGDGMAEDIITDLSKLKALFVIARNSSFQYRGGDLDLRQVGRDLGVAYLLEGSVRRAGDTLRINAQLIDARTGGHVWAERFDGKAGDIFALQDKVTGQVVESLQVVLTAAEVETIAVWPTEIPEAHDAYLQGISHMERRTKEDFAKAKRWFDRALELDPTYPDALGARAELYVDAWQRGWHAAIGISERVEQDVARAALAALKRPSVKAFLVEAELRLQKPDPVGVAAAVNRAQALAPNNPDVLLWQAIVAAQAGKRDRAFAFVDRAMQLDPKYPPVYLGQKANIHRVFGENETAVELYTRVLQRIPDDWIYNLSRAAALAELGRIEEAKADLEIAKRNWPEIWGSQFTAPVIAWFWGRQWGEAYAGRLRNVFIAAGVPEFPDGHDLKVEHRRTKEEVLARRKDGFRLRGICCGGGEWMNDVQPDGRRQSYWNGAPTYKALEVVLEDGSVRVVRDDWWLRDTVCQGFRNPDGSNETLDAYIANCTHGLYPYGVFPLPE